MELTKLSKSKVNNLLKEHFCYLDADDRKEILEAAVNNFGTIQTIIQKPTRPEVFAFFVPGYHPRLYVYMTPRYIREELTKNKLKNILALVPDHRDNDGYVTICIADASYLLKVILDSFYSHPKELDSWHGNPIELPIHLPSLDEVLSKIVAGVFLLYVT